MDSSSDEYKKSEGKHAAHEKDPIVEGKRPFLSKPWFYVLNIAV